ncbi:hypothetical protein BDN72DRAFT_898547 [Pluteus cervinus]|uniref:Uncharacterized protein n=1 Tax=Pluteus cervinus TaxID=181527 RepID=A0ACD3AQG0_9AGAR|nr:hypothetical protein BDN72DRAFT_898547 [Pluteus cervinus]
MNNEGAEAPDVVNLLDFELFVPRLEDIFEISANPESTNLFSYLPLSTLTSFTTTCNIHVDVWVKIFGTLPKLKHISVSGTYALNVFSAIIKDVEDKFLPSDDERVNSERNGDGAKQTMQIGSPSARPVDFMPVFPQLERIELQSATFPEDLFDLIRALHARNGVGRGVKTLKITECKNVDESTCEALRECVDSVVWDEWAPVSEDDSDEFAMGSESGGD